MKKYLFTIMIALAMLITIIPVEVFASDVIDTEEELIAALEAGGEVTLGGNITIEKKVEIYNDITLDFNGYTITLVKTPIGENLYTTGSLCFGDDFNPCNATFKDSTGNGGIVDNATSAIYLYNGVYTIESCKMPQVNLCGGELFLESGIIDSLLIGGNEIIPSYVYLNDSTTVNEWVIYIATLNFNPTEYLYSGFGVTDNGDGTYTTKYVNVEETGETYTIYFYNWNFAKNRYHIGKSSSDYNSPAENIDVVIYNVKGNIDDNVIIPMTKLDEEGKTWKAEIDIAYKNATIQFHNPDTGRASFSVVTPKTDNLIYNYDNNWTKFGIFEILEQLENEIDSYYKETIIEDDKDRLKEIIKEVDEYLDDDQYLSDLQVERFITIKEKALALIEVVDAGDSSNLMLCIILMAISILGIFVSIKCKNVKITA